MKSAMQEAEDAEEESGEAAKPVNQKKILSPEEKAKKDEKARARAAQVCEIKRD